MLEAITNLQNEKIVAQYVTIQKYAEIYSISVSTVRRHICSGALDSVRFGRCIRIPANAVPKLNTQKQIYASDKSYSESLKMIIAKKLNQKYKGE